MNTKISRRNFLQWSAGLGALATLGQFNFVRAATANAAPNSSADYKALICIFLAGGNDGHNVVVPLSGSQYTAYTSSRGSLALPPSQLLTINAGNAPFGLHYGLPKMQNLYTQGKMAILANVGNLVRPTLKSGLSNLPTNLFSHSDQTVQIQSGAPNSSLGTGWGGRVADAVSDFNAGANFPSAVSLSGTSLFCTGDIVHSASLVPGNDLSQYAMSIYPPSAGNARSAAQSNIVSGQSNFELVNAANSVLKEANRLNPILKSASGSPGFTVQFPQTSIGSQLREVARIIGLNPVLGMSRQVFFCTHGGFDTHSGQAYQQWDLLRQLDDALFSFQTATEELGVGDKVTAFTASEFGRTLQSNGGGSDHGWGSHHLVVGGAVKGGAMYGAFPSLVLGGADDYDFRGILIPTTSLAQYGATLAKWFGVGDQNLDALFPTLSNFNARDLGFMN